MNAYKQYKEQTIYTMTKSELLQLVYNELLKRLTRAELALDTNQMDVFEQSITRSREIVQYLMDTLNHNYPISRELNQMYQFFIYELSRINSSRKKEIIQELKPLVTDLRDAFLEAGKRCGY